MTDDAVVLLDTTIAPMLVLRRAIILSILKDRPSFRKTEVAALAKEQGVQFTDGLLSKAIKDLCVSRGSLWALKG